MIAMHAQELLAPLTARVVGTPGRFVGVALDSRKLVAGQAFVALRGAQVDGHDFVADVAQRGASIAIVERAVDAPVAQLVVANTELALATIARLWRARCKARTIGITGSNGKTTLKTLTASILARTGRCHVNPGNLNNEIGLPLSLCALPQDADFAVCEMGAGKPGDIAYLAQIAAPDIGIVNNVAAAHLERMGSVAGVAAIKGALLSALPSTGTAVINADDAFAGYFKSLAGKRAQISFALDRVADVRGRIVSRTPTAQRLHIDSPAGPIEIDLALPGRHNAANALAATALALAAGATCEQIAAGLSAARAVDGRLVRQSIGNGVTLIDDSYNANPASMRAAIDTLSTAPAPRWLVLGDMKELGADGAALHSEVGGYAHASGIERLYAVGELSRHACAGYGPSARHFDSQAELIACLRADLVAGVTLLTKGSRSSAMDRVAKALSTHDAATDAAPGGSHAS